MAETAMGNCQNLDLCTEVGELNPQEYIFHRIYGAD